MLKAILLIFAIGLVYWYFWGQQKRGKGPAASDPASPPPAIPEKMVICAYCQLRVPESECIAATGRHYCCDEHRQLDAP